MNTPKEKQLEAAWDKQEPSCLSCGWSPCYYEIRDYLLEQESGVYHAHCISKDDDHSYQHRGYFLYLDEGIHKSKKPI